MSVKAQGLVWDLQCPENYNGINFKPSHKFVLIAYADHADHNGKNIFPAVATIAKKTGLDDRTVQRLTRDLDGMGLLIDDGLGPRGTNRWALPYSEGGDKLTPLTNCRGDKSDKSLGDIPSGDIPSGDKLTPELNKPEQEELIKKEILIGRIRSLSPNVFQNNAIKYQNWERKLESNDVRISGDEHSMLIEVRGMYDTQFSLADVWDAHYKKSYSNYGLELAFKEME